MITMLKEAIMCMKDLIVALHADGVQVSETQVRWAINSGRTQRPPLDGSLRFDFSPEHLAELRTYFKKREADR